MTGLVVKLKPNEKLLINGVVLQNGDRPARLRVRSENVSLLRSRDALRPEEADTPLKRIYFSAQLVVAGDASPETTAQEILQALADVAPVFSGDASKVITQAREGAASGKFFIVMRALKKLFPLEAALLARRTR